jgi:hypothetical protein
VQQLLQQLGCSKEALLWSAMEINVLGSSIEVDVISLSDGCRKFRNHSKAFLLDSSPAPVLALPQLHDMQQLLQLYMLLPNALMQWVADLSDSSITLDYASVCEHGLNAAMCLANMYPRCAQVVTYMPCMACTTLCKLQLYIVHDCLALHASMPHLWQRQCWRS